MQFKPHNNARLLTGDLPHGRFRIEVGNHSGPIFDAAGNQIGTLTMEMREPLPPQEIPADYDPLTLKRGGCCDPPGDE